MSGRIELSSAMRLALSGALMGDLVATRAGWLPMGKGWAGASSSTVQSLAQRGLLQLHPEPFRKGRYSITLLGREAIGDHA